MRVVCDNCGAVYKIADAKLSKDVNKATCKRCGHKIVIYKPGTKSAPPPPDPAADEGNEERTVIRSVPELQQFAQQSSGGLPAIGSLTAELRAVTSPALPQVGTAAPSLPALGPHTGSTPIVPPAAPRIASPPPSPAPPPPPPTPSSASMSAPVGRPPLPPSPSVPSPSPSVRPPSPSVPPPKLPPPPTPAAPSVTPPAMSTKSASPADSTQALLDTLRGDASAELGLLVVFGVFGLSGAFAASLSFLPPQVNAIGIALAAFGSGVCFLLPMLSQRGRRSGRLPIAVVLALVLAGIAGALAFSAIGDPVAPPPPAAVKVPSPSEVVPADLPTDGATEISPAAIAGLGNEPEPTPPPDPTPAPKTAAPTKAAAAVASKPTPKREPKPKKKDPLARNKKRTGGSSSGPPITEAPTPKSQKKGGPSPFVIDTIIRNNAAILRCFNVEKSRGTEVAGKVYMKFSIAPDGTVSRARITTSRFTGTALDTCVSREVNQLTFPAFDGASQTVTYPFIIS